MRHNINKTTANRGKQGPMAAEQRAMAVEAASVETQWSVVGVGQSFSGPRHEAD
jgi:hypothetical protein